MTNLMSKAAWAYWQGGLSIIPINAATKRPYGKLLPQATNEQGEPLFYKKADDGSWLVTTEATKIHKGTWAPYQERQATQDEVEHWLHNGISSLAVIGGMVSGGVEILDFDVTGYYEQWSDVVAGEDDILPAQRTGGGNWQVAYRCEQPEPNQKLAWHPDETQKSGRRVAIETRGVNGYAVLPPSLHPSGNYYQLVRGRFSQIPTIDMDHRNFLLTCARALCQAPKTLQEIAAEKDPRRSEPREPYEGDSVIDAFNAKYSVGDMLQRYGYSRLQNGRYSRPGKPDSAGVVVNPTDNKSYHMSSNDVLDSEGEGKRQPRSPFDFLRVFDHNGDYRSAVKAAATELGMIDQRIVERNTQRFFTVAAWKR